MISAPLHTHFQPPLQVYENRAALDAALAQTIASQLTQGINQRGQASLAVSGGKTPLGLFQQLCKQSLAWEKVSITLADDRWLPITHHDSNEKLVREHLLQGHASAAQFVSLITDDTQPEAAIARIEQRLMAIAQPFDVVVLGMGEDGHTASLFPCAKPAELATAMATDNPHTVAAMHPTTAPYARISLTLACLARTRHVFVHLVGDSKKGVYQHALAEGKLPIAQVVAAAHQAGNAMTCYWAA